MNFFQQKAKERYVTVTRLVSMAKTDLPIPTFCCGNMQNIHDFVTPCFGRVKQHFKEQENRDKKVHRYLMISDNENAVIQTAAFMAMYIEEIQSDEEDEWHGYDEEDDDEEWGERVLMVDFPNYGNTTQKEAAYQMVVAATNKACENHILFTGLNNDSELEKIIPAIACSEKRGQYVAISSKQLKISAIQRLIYEYGYEVFELPKLGKNYYESVLGYLLRETEYSFAPGLKKEDLLRRLRKKRGNRLGEEDLAVLLDMGAENARKDNGRTMLKAKDFKDSISGNQLGSWAELKRMKGLEEIKEVTEELVAFTKEQQQNERLGSGHNHMVFYGNPGTGKSTVAEMLAKILAEEGCSNGNFVLATRKDLVGEYVGHTAPMVAKKFEEAKGGILFVDEAGFLLQKQSGGFVDEAVKEFVRYMEKETDVMVIFAMYPKEAEQLLGMDAGIKSRVKRFVEFKDYDIRQLVDIAVSLFAENGYKVEKGCRPAIKKYIIDIKERDGEKFGNVRVVRNLVETSITQTSLRHFRDGWIEDDFMVKTEDVNQAIRKMHGVGGEKKKNYGFCSWSNRGELQVF